MGDVADAGAYFRSRAWPVGLMNHARSWPASWSLIILVVQTPGEARCLLLLLHSRLSGMGDICICHNPPLAREIVVCLGIRPRSSLGAHLVRLFVYPRFREASASPSPRHGTCVQDSGETIPRRRLLRIMSPFTTRTPTPSFPNCLFTNSENRPSTTANRCPIITVVLEDDATIRPPLAAYRMRPSLRRGSRPSVPGPASLSHPRSLIQSIICNLNASGRAVSKQSANT